MKKHLSFCAVLLIAGTSTALMAGEGEAPSVEAAFVDPGSPEAAPYRGVGEDAIGRLMMTMITDTSGAVARHTEVASLPTFHLKDLPLKNGTVAGLPRITAVKLTSQKLLNPANAPDAAEQLALARVQADLEAGTPPRVLVQRIDRAGGGTEWRVYKPLAMIRQCGTCHAAAEEQSPELRTALHERFPSDAASSYAIGQWRGLIRVTVAEPAAPVAPGASAATPPKK
jgi:hypothetical protein